MKTLFKLIASIAAFLFLITPLLSTAQSTEEAIISFSSDIIVNADNSIDVTETIVYGTGPSEHHGIFRDIRTESSAGKTMKIDNVIVSDENLNPHMYTTSQSGGNYRLKIGDPDRTFSGQKTYVIRYHASRAIAQLDDKDEIYWNVTGNEWGFPIYAANARVMLPGAATTTETACYLGASGSTERCDPAQIDGGLFSFSSGRSLSPGEGFTVAVGFSKGIVAPYTTRDFVNSLFESILPWIIAGILPIVTLILSVRHWHRKGRDPKGTGVIIAQYDVPDNLTPMEVAGILNEKITIENISAEIIYLATKGYLKIAQIEEKTLGVFTSSDYELTRLKDSVDLANDFDRKIMSGLLADPIGATKKLSDLKNEFYMTADAAIYMTADGLLAKGYYKNLGGMKTRGRIFLFIFLAIWAGAFFGGVFAQLSSPGNPFSVGIGIFLSVIIYGIVSHFNPAKTEKGVATKEYLLGLKTYLQIAEKDRLLFHNAPEKKPEIFEKLLPYAMALGVADIWAKEFQDIYMTPPNWYSGASSSGFNAVMLSNALSGFNTAAASTLASSPSSGGSGGGGSSGGGGGGGGGGSW